MSKKNVPRRYISISMLSSSFVLSLTLSGAMMAQQTTADPWVAPAATPSGPQSPQWRGFNVEEKLRYDALHLFEVGNMVYAGIGAALDQGRNRPAEWGQGWDAFSEQYASHVGQYLVQRSIMFPVQAIDGEDTVFSLQSE